MMNIRDTYRNIYIDIRDRKYFLIFTIALFFAAAALSVFNFPELKGILYEALDAIRRMSQDYHSKALPYVIADIFLHNALASFVALFSGVLFSFIPVSIVIANGYLIGFVMIPNFSYIGWLIPHGIFELPALALACSYGIWLGLWPLKRGRIETVKLRLRQCVAIYLYVVVPLLIIAASIEGSLIKYTLRH